MTSVTTARAFLLARILLLPALVVAPFGEGGARPFAQLVLQTVLAAAIGLVIAAGEVRLLRPPAAGPLSVFLLLGGVSALLAASGYPALLRCVDLAFLAAAVAAGAALFHEPEWRARLAAAVTASAAVQALLAGGQATGLVEAPRISGGFLNPNHLAAWLGASALIAAGAALAAATSGERRSRTGLWLAGAAAAMAGLLLTASRGATAGLIAGGLVLGFTLRARLDARVRRALLRATACVALLATAVLLARFRNEDLYRWDRMRIWPASLHVLTEPLPSPAAPAFGWRLAFGIGPGQFDREAPPFAPSYDDRPVRYPKRLDQTHSDPLQVLVEQGAAGAAAALVLFAALVVLTRRRLAAADGAALPVLAGAAAAVGALAVHSCVENLSSTPALLLLGGLIAGSVAAGESPVPVPVKPPGSRGKALAVLALAYVWFVALFGPWQADRLFAQSRAGAGLPALERALSVNPYRPELHAARASFAATEGDGGRPAVLRFAAAAAELDAARRLDPRNAVRPRESAILWREGFGQIFHDRSSLEEALAACHAAISLDPRDPMILIQKGTLLASVGRRDEAAAEFANARALEPNFFTAWLYGARLEQERGNAPEAQRLESEARRRHDALSGYAPEAGNEYETAILAWPAGDAP